MPITRESLIARKQDLAAAAEQLKAQLLSVNGALADVEYWLDQLDDEPNPVNKENEDA